MPADFFGYHLRIKGKTVQLAVKVPAEYGGYRPGDKVLMVMGGSGGYFAFALSKRGEQIGAEVWRVKPDALKSFRQKNKGNREDDAKILTDLYREKPDLFYKTFAKDLDLILLNLAQNEREAAKKNRIACEQRIFQNLIGQIFCNEDGYFPDGDIEKAYLNTKANDGALQNFIKLEKNKKKRLEQILDRLPVYTKIH
jgi:hypothetical protein